jgi:hypothetical protein
MNIEEARSNVGRMVMSTDPGWKMVKKLPPHGPYFLLQVTKGGTGILCGGQRVTPSHLTLYEEPAAHATENKSETTGDASKLSVVSVFLVMQFDPPTCSDSLLGVYLNRKRAKAFAATHTHGPTPVRVEEWKDGVYGPTL